MLFPCCEKNTTKGYPPDTSLYVFLNNFVSFRVVAYSQDFFMEIIKKSYSNFL